MSQHSDDVSTSSGSDSFWEPGNYKVTVKRVEDGFKLCNDMITLIQERSEIEKGYGKSLKTWSKKWSELIEKGPEYGTTEAAWRSLCEEADRRCDLHVNVKDRLLNEIISSIKQWQKDSYHKSMMYLKEKKECDDNFKKAQKPWAKLLEKLTKAKTDYHTSCKNERSAINQERNATGDTSLSPDQVKKLQERVVKCKEEVARNREKYEASLKELTDYNQKYQDDMTEVFEKCQEFEEKRLNFFKETMFGIHACLDISSDPTLAKIYSEFRQVIDAADSGKDLKWWSQNHGTGMPPNWPVFEEYTPDLHNISKKERKIVSQMINHDSVTLTHVNHHPIHVNKFASESNHLNSTVNSANNHQNNHQIHVHSHLHSNTVVSSMNNGRNGSNGTHSSTSSNHSGSSSHGKSVHISENHPHHHHSVVTSSSAAGAAPKRYMGSSSSSAGGGGVNGINSYPAPDNKHAASSSGGGGGGGSSHQPGPHHAAPSGGDHHFEDEHEDWDDYPKDALIDNGEQGVPVKALYDYEGAEADELSFKQGDEFEKLEDEDEQGWCKGRKDGRVGLYPANYVEPIPLPLPVK